MIYIQLPVYWLHLAKLDQLEAVVSDAVELRIIQRGLFDINEVYKIMETPVSITFLYFHS